MSTPVSDFDFRLPKDRIAQHSVEPRDASRMLFLDRCSGKTSHHLFHDLPGLLRPGDLLVFNNTKVFKARLEVRLRGKMHELFLLRCLDGPGYSRSGVRPGSDPISRWEALIRGARRFCVGDAFSIGDLSARLVQKSPDTTGAVEIEIDADRFSVLTHCDRYGHIPVPLYVEREPERMEDYQTIYADPVGSVAAPTSGFHFTDRVFDALLKRGVEKTFVTLHVGLGTFQPVRTETLEEHTMHAEWVEIREEAAEAINRAKREGRRVIAVGTTVVRTLEGVAKMADVSRVGGARPYQGDINIFITPGFDFKIIDGLLTNFHLPKSTLLALVCAFAGRERVLNGYEEAVLLGYRFYSFGDAMFIS